MVPEWCQAGQGVKTTLLSIAKAYTSGPPTPPEALWRTTGRRSPSLATEARETAWRPSSSKMRGGCGLRWGSNGAAAPSELPPGFGVRWCATAFGFLHPLPKRQSTAALQDASAQANAGTGSRASVFPGRRRLRRHWPASLAGTWRIAAAQLASIYTVAIHHLSSTYPTSNQHEADAWKSRIVGTAKLMVKS